MNLAELILDALKLSIVLMVFGFGLLISWQDAISLFRRPLRLALAILAMNVAMPAFAVAIAVLLKLRPEVAVILIAFTLSPMPPFLPVTQMRAGIDAGSAAGLLVASSVFAIVIIPVGMILIGRYFDRSLTIPFAEIIWIILISVLAPLVAGVGVAHLAPAFAGRIARPVSLFAGVLLALSTIAITITSFSAMIATLGDRTLLAILLTIAAGVGLGYLVGGSRLALATAARHPGVALAIAGANIADQKPIVATVLLYLIVGLLVLTPFASWRGRRRKRALEQKLPRVA